jgi:hypothetical protein
MASTYDSPKSAFPLRRILPGVNVFFSLDFAFFTLHLFDTFTSRPFTHEPQKEKGTGTFILSSFEADRGAAE